jgi:hypothetical protein
LRDPRGALRLSPAGSKAPPDTMRAPRVRWARRTRLGRRPRAERPVLGRILGHTELLIDHEHELPPEVHWSLALLLRTGQRLIDVVAGICDLVHVASVDPHAADAVDVSELVAHELAACRDRADQRGVLAMAAGDVGAVSVADSRRLRRELLDNALTMRRTSRRCASRWSPRPPG